MKEKHVLRNAIIRDIFDLVKLNVIFVVCCFPVISIPSAIGAMTKINVQLQNGDSCYVIGDFLRYFRVNFIKNTVSGLCLAAAALVFGYVFWFYQSAESPYGTLFSLLLVLTLLPLLLCYCASCYLWVMNGVMELPMRKRLKNAVLLSVICLKESGLFLLVGALIVVVAYYGVPYTTPFLLVFGLSLWNYICTYYAYGAIKKYLDVSGADQKEEP